MDADLRRPGIHAALEMNAPSSGLSTLLQGKHSFEDVLLRIPELSNLFVLLAGPAPAQAAELLGSELMKQCVARWRRQFDHIIIDTPPVLSVTDPVVLATEADAVLLVVRAGSTPVKALINARDLLSRVKNPDVVINSLDLSTTDQYYQYGSGYSAKYYDANVGRRAS